MYTGLGQLLPDISSYQWCSSSAIYFQPTGQESQKSVFFKGFISSCISTLGGGFKIFTSWINVESNTTNKLIWQTNELKCEFSYREKNHKKSIRPSIRLHQMYRRLNITGDSFVPERRVSKHTERKWETMIRYSEHWLIPCLSNLISLQCSHSLWKFFVRGVSKTQTTIVTIPKGKQFAIWSYHCRVLEATRHLQTEPRRKTFLRKGA